jgi:thiamine transport system permease protein
MKSRIHEAEYTVAFSACAVTAFIVLAFVLPLGAAVSPLFSGTRNALFSPSHIFRITRYTFRVALGSTLIAASAGIPAAAFTANRSFPGRKLFLSLSAVPLSIPPLIIALGFVSIFGMNGLLNAAAVRIFNLNKAPFTFLYSYAGVIIAQGFYNFPLVMAVVSEAWERIPSDEQDAARMLGAGKARIFFTVTIHKLAPAAGAACIPVFLYCFFSFMIVLLFGTVGGTTLEVEIYQAARTTLDFRTASLLALIETACAIAAVFAYSRVLLGTPHTSASGVSHVRTPVGCGRYESRPESAAERVMFTVLALIIIVFFVFPLAGIFAGAFRQRGGILSLVRIFTDSGFGRALAGTLLTAPVTAFLCCVTAFVYASLLRTKDPSARNTMMQTLPMLPMAVSSVVMGYGMNMLMHRGTVIALIASQTALAWPVAFRQIYASLCAVPEQALDASRMMSRFPPDTVFRIMIPSAKRSILSSFGFCFAISMGDTTLPLVLGIPRFDTLALYTYRLAGSYRFAQSCACGAVLCLLCALVFSIGKKHE